MVYEQSFSEARDLADRALAAMAQRAIPPQPINFALWYEFFLARHPALVAALEPVQRGERPYSAEMARALYEQYLARAELQRVHEVQGRISGLLTDALGTMELAGTGVTAFLDRLRWIFDQLGRSDNLEEVRPAIARLLDETEGLMSSHQHYEEQLSTSTDQLAKLREELKRVRDEAARDPLTALANRKLFDETLAAWLDERRQTPDGHGPCLLMIDIDHFKAVNDAHGHILGDKVLKFLAATFQDMVKGKDMVARYGGEEFALVLNDVSRPDAVRLADGIRRVVERARLKRSDTGSPIGQVTISVGVGCAAANDDAESLVARADRALYYAKRRGRNRVAWAAQGDASPVEAEPTP